MTRSVHSLLLAAVISLVFAIALVVVSAAPSEVKARPVPIAIDFGSEFIKVSSVKPGAGSYHIVVDEQSKRKIPAVISFEGGERYFGNGATQFTAKKPKETYWFAHRLLGKTIASPEVAEFRAQGFPYEIVSVEDRRTLGFKHHVPHSTSVVYTVEEVVAMSLEHIVRIAEADAEAIVAGAVITVPNHWSQVERQAMLDAADLAGLNVYALLNENTAAALQYGIDRKYDNETEAHTIMLYNMGATSTKVTIATFAPRAVKDGRKNRTEGSLEILAVAYDPNLGAQYFEAALTSFIAEQVNQQLKAKGLTDDIHAHLRSYAKIRIAAEKAKVVLSANSETHIHLASLLHDIDFKLHITREQFYSLIKHLLDRVPAPITAALSDAGLSASDLASVTIIGGGVRIPAVQSLIQEHTAVAKLGQSLNGDEAMAMGAEFKAIELSKQFKTRPFTLEDVTPYGVAVELTDLEATSDSETWSKTASLFKRYNKLSKKKTLSLPHDRDFTATLFFDENSTSHLPPSVQPTILQYHVTGLTAAGSNDEYTKLLETQKPRVSAVFLLDQSGIVNLISAEATLEETVQVPVKKPKKIVNATAAVNNDTTTDTDSESLPATDTEAASEATDPASNETSSAEEPEAVEYTEKKVTHRIPLLVTPVDLPNVLRAMNFSEKREARLRLSQLRAQDELKKSIAIAKNDLESFIYGTRSSVNEGRWDEVSTSEMRDQLFAALSEAEDWLYDQNDDSPQPFIDKLASLKALSEPIELRHAELTELPKAIQAAQSVLNSTQTLVKEFTANRPWVSKEELEKLSNLTSTNEQWLAEKQAAQSSLSKHDDLVLTSRMIYESFAPMLEVSQRLSKIKKPAEPKPKKPKVPKAKKNATTSVNDTASGEAEDVPAGEEFTGESGASGSANTNEYESANGASSADVGANDAGVGGEEKTGEARPNYDEL